MIFIKLRACMLLGLGDKYWDKSNISKIKETLLWDITRILKIRIDYETVGDVSRKSPIFSAYIVGFEEDRGAASSLGACVFSVKFILCGAEKVTVCSFLCEYELQFM